MNKIHGLKGPKWEIRKKENSTKSKVGFYEKIIDKLLYIRDKIFQKLYPYKEWVPTNEDEIFEEWKRFEGLTTLDHFETH